ncbi:hypothetical protein OSH10_04950 [Kaistia defluvii]|uniref:hypothetical protein n=1 Tax=Kaistia defluvii TaxID=410841 RepID=UPI00224F43DE|nr:hypothetical protein [Kaistia defluvii]MCX5517774.1 hypothetical protein [Kaistia defluvii]
MNFAVGFRRVGVVLGAIPFLIGLVMLAGWAYNHLTTPRGPWEKYSGADNALWLGLGWIALSVFLFVASWAIGWIVRGFSKGQNTL